MELSMYAFRTAFVLAAISMTSLSASGQSGQSTIAASAQAAVAQVAAQPQAPTGPVRPLSIDDATRLALEQNLGIRIQRFEPQIQDVSVWQAKSFWAPQLSSSVFRQ